MGNEITKKDFEELGLIIIEAVDQRFNRIEDHIDRRFNQFEKRIEILEEKIGRLVTTLDNFLKRLTDHEDEFIILKAEMDKVKGVIKEKLGVEIMI